MKLKVLVTTAPGELRLRRLVALCSCKRGTLEVIDPRTGVVLITVYDPAVSFHWTHNHTEIQLEGKLERNGRECVFVFA